MASEEQMLKTIRSQTLAMIQQLTESPKPSYSVDGQTVSWADYLEQLRSTATWCDEQLQTAEPFEFVSRGVT